MKNWKTTIIGCAVAGLIAIQALLATGDVDVKQLLIAFLVAAFAAVSKDYNVTGK